VRPLRFSIKRKKLKRKKGSSPRNKKNKDSNKHVPHRRDAARAMIAALGRAGTTLANQRDAARAIKPETLL
jgi:hypothetical protein